MNSVEGQCTVYFTSVKTAFKYTLKTPQFGVETAIDNPQLRMQDAGFRMRGRESTVDTNVRTSY